MAERYELEAPLWRYEGAAAWHFLTLPRDASSEIREQFGGMAAGFGSLRVEVGIGGTSWRTSIFPDSRSGCYLLPVKAQVRKQEGISAGDLVTFVLQIL